MGFDASLLVKSCVAIRQFSCFPAGGQKITTGQDAQQEGGESGGDGEGNGDGDGAAQVEFSTQSTS